MIDRLETERMIVRPVRIDDIELFVELDADPEVMRFLTGGTPTPPAEVAEMVRGSLGYRWTAFAGTTGAFLGWFALQPSPEHEGERVLGYRLRQAAWGRGLATEGSRALIAWAFTQPDTQRVTAQTMTVNTRSRRVMEHCGLRYVRTFFDDWHEPIEGSELGDVEYELTRAEWVQRRAAAERGVVPDSPGDR